MTYCRLVHLKVRSYLEAAVLNGIVPLSFPVSPIVSDPESTLNIGPESGVPEPDTAEIDPDCPQTYH